jgi:hypothetical protein
MEGQNKIIGYIRPVAMKPTQTTVSCKCRNCGARWTEIVEAYAVKNSLYEYDYCSECKGVA